MEKVIYVSNLNDLNKEERKYNCASYLRVMDSYAPNRVLSNNIVDFDPSIWENAQNLFDEEDNEKEIFQYFLTNLDEYSKEKLIEYGFIISYSDLLDLDVIMVDHSGTPWESVMTDVRVTNDLDEFIGD